MIRCAYADIPGGQIHYRYRSGSGTPVVFLHQTASSSRMFVDTMGLMPQIGSLYALDTPGFGGSFDPEGMPTMPQYGAWLLAAIDAVGLDQFHLVGHHTGACIAVEIAAAVPDRVLSIALIGPVPLTESERSEFRKHFSTPFSPTPDGSYLKQTWDYLATLGANSSLALHQRELVDTVRAYYGRFQAYSSVWDQDFTALFQALSCPLLLMCAPNDVLIDFFDRSQTLRPDATAVLLKGANFEPDQDPEGTAAALETFIIANT